MITLQDVQEKREYYSLESHGKRGIEVGFETALFSGRQRGGERCSLKGALQPSQGSPKDRHREYVFMHPHNELCQFITAHY